MADNRMGAEAETNLEAFEQWVRVRRLAPEQRLRFFVGWVERFLRLRAARRREDWQDTLRVFLEDLSQGQAKSWQLRQAADAVTLYCGQFCEPTTHPCYRYNPPKANRLIQIRYSRKCDGCWNCATIRREPIAPISGGQDGSCNTRLQLTGLWARRM